ncbi:hypothetical protein [Streptomyces mirabilis]|uniref:hypothetical protein n=1 Tax=Streptomyces mirabilis TaxID=68239 RepID=UPI0033F3EEFC
MNARLALHWTAVLIAAACLMTVVTIPFTGIAASAVGVLAGAAVCLVGLATAPTLNTRKDRRS